MMNKLMLLFVVLMVAMTACKKDVDIFNPDPFVPEPNRVEASILGTVIDENENPVVNAEIRLENNTIFTNDLGIFYLKDLEMYEDAYLTVRKDGFFEGSRRLLALEKSVNQVKVMLLSNESVGQFDAGTGGQIDAGGGTTIAFPANGIQTASGSAYSGMVDVSAKPLHTDDRNMSVMMPGDLSAFNEANEQVTLGSFGMVAVEMRGASGEILQLAEGSQATIEFQIASKQLAVAPSTIPLWHFDEELGYWIEEGEAVLSGDKYVGEVSHFSFWNCDAPFPLIHLEGCIQFENAESAQFVQIKITVPSLNTSGYASTNDDGVFAGKVPKDEVLILTVVQYLACGEVIYEQEIGPFSNDVVLDKITLVPSDEVSATVISGAIVDCDGNPVTEGVVEISFGQHIILPTDSLGMFSYTFYNCSEEEVTVQGFDYTNEKETLPATYAPDVVIDAGTLTACESLSEFLRIFAPADTINFFTPQISAQSEWATISASGIDSTYFYATVMGAEVGTFGWTENSGQTEIFLDLGFGFWGKIDSGEITFTYFGEIGDFVTGTFNAVYEEYSGNDFQSYTITGSFSILRE